MFSLHDATLLPDAVGRQFGHLRLPPLSPATPFAVRLVPAAVLSHGRGPTAALICTQRNVPEGLLTLLELAREIDLDRLAGRVIVLPCLAELTEAELRLCSENWLTSADLVIEIGGGGPRLRFDECAARVMQGSTGQQRQSESALIAFGAANSVRLEAPPAASRVGESMLAADRPWIWIGAGGAASATAASLAAVRIGLRNVLIHLGILKASFALRATRVLSVGGTDHTVRAAQPGYPAFHRDLGQPVYAGDKLLTLYSLDEPGHSPTHIKVPRDGVLLARHHGMRVAPGECLAIIAEALPC